MYKKITFFLSLFIIITTANAQKIIKDAPIIEQSKQKTKPLLALKNVAVKDSIKINIVADTTKIDTLTIWKIYKETARSSYYAGKFNGRKMANGKRFDMTKLTVAHKKLPFGTKLKITNIINQKSVIVEVTDRGPFVKSREIDLSKRAFTDIANDKNSGLMTVKIEISE